MANKEMKVTPEKDSTKAAPAVKAETAGKATVKEVKPAEESKQVTAEPKKSVAKKAAPAKKSTRKTSAKKKEVEKVEEVWVQFGGQEIIANNIVSKAKQDYVADGHRESSIKTVRVYIKPEENMAYYVINDKFKGSVEL